MSDTNLSIKAQVQAAVKAAMLAHDNARRDVLRLIMAEFKQVEVDKRIVLDREQELAILNKMQKKRKDAISQFQAAGRDDLVTQEEYEVGVIQEFKPASTLSSEALAQLVKDTVKQVDATSVKDMGKVMAHLKPLIQGQADMADVSALVKACLDHPA